MKKESKGFLMNLLGTIGPSGFENEPAEVWKKEARKFADRVTADRHGNVIAVVNAGGSPRVMLAGHVDEIGFMVSHIDEQGFVWFQTIGGWDAQVVVGQRVWIRGAKGRVTGVVGKKAIHLLQEADRTKVSKIEDLWVDIGAKDRKETQKRVGIGDPMVLAWNPEEMGSDRIVSRGLDDRAGAFVSLETARMLSRLKPKAEIHAVATVQEEIGLRGAHTSAYGIDPVAAVAIDVHFSTDHPQMGGEKVRIGESDLGKGPVISRGANINQKMYDLLVTTAKKRKIPHQINPAPRGTGTDANAIQLSRGGVATALVSVPNRYMHSPCEMVSLKDLDNTVALLAYALEQINDKTVFLPY
jgi:endoglucanase